MSGNKYGRRIIAELKTDEEDANIRVRETIGGEHSSTIAPIVFETKKMKKHKAAKKLILWLLKNGLCDRFDVINWGISYGLSEGHWLCRENSDEQITLKLELKKNGGKNGEN